MKQPNRISSVADSIDPLCDYVGKLCVVLRSNNKNFSALLVTIKGSDYSTCELWFENKAGVRFMMRRDTILGIFLAKNQPPIAEVA